MSDNLKLGQLITGPAERDCSHTAVAPVTIGGTQRLAPGTWVNLVEGSDSIVAFAEEGKGIGIIDPWLIGEVRPGDRCYLHLKPGSITSLRHEWTHPAFESVQRAQAESLADEKAASEAWLRQYAAEISPYDLDEHGADYCFKKLIEGLRSGEVFAHGTGLHGFYELRQPDELKIHAEAYLGITIHLPGFQFSCSC